MMARTKRSRRSYGAGEWGRKRVRVFPDPKADLYQIEWRENGRRLTRSLGNLSRMVHLFHLPSPAASERIPAAGTYTAAGHG